MVSLDYRVRNRSRAALAEIGREIHLVAPSMPGGPGLQSEEQERSALASLP